MTDRTSDAPALEVEVVAVEDLRRHPSNYRAHPPDQVERIAESIEQHGVYRNVVVAEDLTILAGHGVVEAHRHLGRTEVPVVRLPVGPDDPRAIKVLIGDNELPLGAASDDRRLAELLRDLADDDEVGGLSGTGYDEQQLAALLYTTRTTSEVPDFDAAAEWAGMPEYDPGEPLVTLRVHFKSEEDRDQFLEDTGVGITARQGRTWSGWWPPRERADRVSLRWESEDGDG